MKCIICWLDCKMLTPVFTKLSILFLQPFQEATLSLSFFYHDYARKLLFSQTYPSSKQILYSKVRGTNPVQIYARTNILSGWGFLMFRVTAGCGFESPAGKLKISKCLSDEKLNRGPV